MRRNLLYTAVTRAKKKAVLIGDRHEISQCILNRDEHTKKTLPAHRLRYNLGSRCNEPLKLDQQKEVQFLDYEVFKRIQT